MVLPCLSDSIWLFSISHSNTSSTYFHYEEKVCVGHVACCSILHVVYSKNNCKLSVYSWRPDNTVRQISVVQVTVASRCRCSFLTPDSTSHLHNPHTCSSNARLTYWLLNNAASNNSDVWSEAHGGTHLKKHTQSAAAGAAWTGLITAGTSLQLDCVHTRSRWGFCLFLPPTSWRPV